MKQIIIEEWDALPFDDSEAADGWIGLEALVDKWEAILQSVVDCEGWDTFYGPFAFDGVIKVAATD